MIKYLTIDLDLCNSLRLNKTEALFVSILVELTKRSKDTRLVRIDYSYIKSVSPIFDLKKNTIQRILKKLERKKIISLTDIDNRLYFIPLQPITEGLL